MQYLERLAGFYAGPQNWSSWNLEMLLFVEEENPEQRLTQRTPAHGRNRTWAKLMGSEGSHYCPIPTHQE